MSLTAGMRLGPYQILAPIGAGGMGEVWKTRDSRLDRIVAIKVSQEKFSERFEREARNVRSESEWIAESGTAATGVSASPRHVWRERTAWILAAVLLGALLFLAATNEPSPAVSDVLRLAVIPPEKTVFSGSFHLCRARHSAERF